MSFHCEIHLILEQNVNIACMFFRPFMHGITGIFHTLHVLAIVKFTLVELNEKKDSLLRNFLNGKGY